MLACHCVYKSENTIMYMIFESLKDDIFSKMLCKPIAPSDVSPVIVALTVANFEICHINFDNFFYVAVRITVIYTFLVTCKKIHNFKKV